jgi:hypothetical protein
MRVLPKVFGHDLDVDQGARCSRDMPFEVAEIGNVLLEKHAHFALLICGFGGRSTDGIVTKCG